MWDIASIKALVFTNPIGFTGGKLAVSRTFKLNIANLSKNMINYTMTTFYGQNFTRDSFMNFEY